MIKANQEKTMKSTREGKKNIIYRINLDKEYEEAAAMKEAEDEGKRIHITRERHQQLRQLFFKQARTNRMKVIQIILPFNCSY